MMHLIMRPSVDLEEKVRRIKVKEEEDGGRRGGLKIRRTEEEEEEREEYQVCE